MNLETRLRSTAMRVLSSEGTQRLNRQRGRLARRLRKQPQGVHYFHQVDDPYSHLVVQKLDALREAYSLPFVVHLVSKPDAPYLGNADKYDQWALTDALSIAGAYGTGFPETSRFPSTSEVTAANDQLAPHLSAADFAERAEAVGTVLWSGRLTGTSGSQSSDTVGAGNRLRAQLGHYQGAMFYFDGEWYWGLDRLRLLEARLIKEGLAAGDPQVRVPAPAAEDTSDLDTSGVLLEYFPSLRSPYTAVGHQRVLGLIARSGVTVKLRPVMPMMMRGVPAPGAKQRYIISDAAREGRAHGTPMGKIVDPFGDPVRRAFALFPGAEALNRGMAFVTAYLEAAWVSGVDITTETGLRQVTDQAGLDWFELQNANQGADWETVLDENLNEMLGGAGLWGVPSFRVSGGIDEAPFACWGQDRIWRVENEIARRAKSTD